MMTSLAGATLFLPGWLSAQAQSPDGGQTSGSDHQDRITLEGDEGFALALRLLIASGRYEDVLALLETRPDLNSRSDVRKLRAQLALQLGRTSESIAILEQVLGETPSDAVARLQLAEAHFAAGSYDAAMLNYQLALAGDLDSMRRHMASARIAEMRQIHGWSVTTAVSIASDSNINSGTDAGSINIFGLPFLLDDQARRKAGVTLSAFGAFQYRAPVTDGIAFLAGASTLVLDSEGTASDLHVVSGNGGFEFLRDKNAHFFLQASPTARWYGGNVLDRQFGVEGGYVYQSNGFSILTALRSDLIDDQLSDARDGWSLNGSATFTSYVGPTSLWRAALTVERREAEVESEGFVLANLSGGWLTAAPYATLVYLEPYVRHRRHTAPIAAFGETREDSELGLSIRISKRDWNVEGFFPFVGVSFTRNHSNIDLFSYSRSRFELGLTKQF